MARRFSEGSWIGRWENQRFLISETIRKKVKFKEFWFRGTLIWNFPPNMCAGAQLNRHTSGAYIYGCFFCAYWEIQTTVAVTASLHCCMYTQLHGANRAKKVGIFSFPAVPFLPRLFQNLPECRLVQIPNRAVIFEEEILRTNRSNKYFPLNPPPIFVYCQRPESPCADPQFRTVPAWVPHRAHLETDPWVRHKGNGSHSRRDKQMSAIVFN